MYSVTRRIRMIKQPPGGYISRKQFTVNILDDGINTNLKYSLQGTTQGNGLTGGLPPVRFSM